MRVALVFPPLSQASLSAPPTEVAAIAARLREAKHTVVAIDANLNLFRRWLATDGNPPPIFDYDPDCGLGNYPPPEWLAATRTLSTAWDRLKSAPDASSHENHVATETAVRRLVELHHAIGAAYNGLLLRIAECRGDLDDAMCRDIFSFEESLFTVADAERPDLYMQIVTEPGQVNWALASAHVVWERHGCPTVIAGAQTLVGLIPADLVRALPYINYVVVGDAEAGVPALVEALAKAADPPQTTDLQGVPGLMFRDAEGQVHTEAAEGPAGWATLANVDKRPLPDFAGLDFADYAAPVPIVRVAASYGRKFDDGIAMFPATPYRARRPKALLDELAAIGKAHGITHAKLEGQLDADWVREFIAAVKKQKMTKWRFSIDYIRPDAAFTADEVPAQLHTAGIRQIGVWVPTGTMRLAEILGDLPDALGAAKFVGDCWLHGIRANLFFTLGWPGQSPEDIGADIATLGKCPCEALSFSCTETGTVALDPAKFGLHIEQPFVSYHLHPSGPDANAEFVHSVHYFFTHAETPYDSGDIGVRIATMFRRMFRLGLNMTHALPLIDTGYFFSLDVEHEARHAAADADTTEPAAKWPAMREQMLRWLHRMNTGEASAVLAEFEDEMKALQTPARGAVAKRRTAVETQRMQEFLWLLIGVCRLSMREFDTAIRAFGKIGKHSPFYPNARWWTASAMVGKNDVPGALRPTTDALAAGLRMPDAYVTLAVAESRAQMNAATARAAELALKFRPAFFALHGLAAKAWEAEANWDAAKPHRDAYRRKEAAENLKRASPDYVERILTAIRIRTAHDASETDGREESTAPTDPTGSETSE